MFEYHTDKTTYTYNADNQMVGAVVYVNDTNRQHTEVLTAYTVNSGATESYSYNGSQRLSRNNIWNEARGVDHNETSYYLYDGRGSVTANTWQNGMVTNVYQYDPYGQVTLGSTEHTDFYGYNAESYNPNTGLEYLRARSYNADKGRFIQEDTYLGDTTDPLTLNRYAYVKNSPLNYIDPSGHNYASGGLPSNKSNNTGTTLRELYENLSSYATGNSGPNNTLPYAAGLQAQQEDSSYFNSMLDQVGNFLSSMMEMAKQVSSNIKCDPLAAVKDIGLGILYSFFENIPMPIMNMSADFRDFFNFDGRKVTRWWNNLEEVILDFGIADEMNFYAGQLIGDLLQVGIALYNLPTLFKNLPSILKKVKDLLP